MSGFSGASSRVPYLPVQIVHYRDQNAVVDKSGWPNRGSLGVAPIAEKWKKLCDEDMFLEKKIKAAGL